MAQLLQKQINTTIYTNAILRNIKSFGQVVGLRIDGVNYPDFSRLSVFKDLVLELGKQVSAEFISDVSIVILRPGETITLNEYDNRLILNLENTAAYSNEESRFTPSPGDLLWTNEELDIQNTSAQVCFLLVIDFREFLL